MKLSVRQRTVYVAATISIVAFVGGYALATATIGSLTVTGGSQSGGYVNTGASALICQTNGACLSSSYSPFASCIPGSVDSTTITAGQTNTVSDVIVVGFNGGVCQQNDFVEMAQLVHTYTATAPACGSSCTDLFLLTSDVNGQTISDGGTVSWTTLNGCSPASTYCVLTVDIYIDYGSSATPALSFVGVTVSGNL